MKFKQVNSESYDQYVVEATYFVTKGQTMTVGPKVFETIDKAINYIKKLKKESKELSEVYKDCKIILHKVHTKETDYIVLEGD